jgi:hypothetical protein
MRGIVGNGFPEKGLRVAIIFSTVRRTEIAMRLGVTLTSPSARSEYLSSGYCAGSTSRRMYTLPLSHMRGIIRGRGGQAMAFLTDDLLRPIVSNILRSDPWRDAFLCRRCLLRGALDQLGPAYSESEVRDALEGIFKKPGALVCMHGLRCGKCNDAVSCLAAK